MTCNVFGGTLNLAKSISNQVGKPQPYNNAQTQMEHCHWYCHGSCSKNRIGNSNSTGGSCGRPRIEDVYVVCLIVC